MATFISHSPEETLALGEAWGRLATTGWILGLSGDLGAGKTQLVRGVARGLGVTSRVQSPSFALVHEYREGRLPLAHLDLYRLDTPAQVVAAGLEQYLTAPEGIAVIEWVERWPDLFLPGSVRKQTRLRRVSIESMGETDRRIVYEDSGP